MHGKKKKQAVALLNNPVFILQVKIALKKKYQEDEEENEVRSNLSLDIEYLDIH